MFIATAVLAALLALGFTTAAVPKVLGKPVAAENARHVGMSLEAFRIIGLLEFAGAAGLIIGLFWAPLGVAAAAGLALVGVGATGSHLRIKDPFKAMAPAVLFAILSVAVLLLRLATA